MFALLTPSNNKKKEKNKVFLVSHSCHFFHDRPILIDLLELLVNSFFHNWLFLFSMIHIWVGLGSFKNKTVSLFLCQKILFLKEHTCALFYCANDDMGQNRSQHIYIEKTFTYVIYGWFDSHAVLATWHYIKFS